MSGFIFEGEDPRKNKRGAISVRFPDNNEMKEQNEVSMMCSTIQIVEIIQTIIHSAKQPSQWNYICNKVEETQSHLFMCVCK